MMCCVPRGVAKIHVKKYRQIVKQTGLTFTIVVLHVKMRVVYRVLHCLLGCVAVVSVVVHSMLTDLLLDKLIKYKFLCTEYFCFFIIKMYKFQAKQSQRFGFYRQENCDAACENCKTCKKDTREYQDCWSSCDACNRCVADSKNSESYDDPYEYRPWFLSVDNHSYAKVPYTKQFCDNICGVKMCNTFRKRHDDYTQCKRCQLKGKCWSPYQKRCIDCSHNNAFKSCERKYGCLNPRGSEFANVAPINPMLTNCMPCWNEQAYTTL